MQLLKGKDKNAHEHILPTLYKIVPHLIEQLSLWTILPVHAAEKHTLNIYGGCSCEASERSSPSAAKYLMGLSDGHNRF